MSVESSEKATIGAAANPMNRYGTMAFKSWTEVQSWCKWAIDHRRPFVLIAPESEIGFVLRIVLAVDETIRDNMVVPLSYT